MAHAVAAVAATFDGDLDRAQSEIEHSAVAQSKSRDGLQYSAAAFACMLGQPLEAIPLIERAMRLDPASTNTQYLHFLGMANLLAGKYETAAALFKQRIALVPGTDFSRVRARVRLSVISARWTRPAAFGANSKRSTRNIRSTNI